MVPRRRLVIASALLLLLAQSAIAAVDRTTGLEATPSSSVPIPRINGANVLWDLTHGVFQGYEPTGNYSSLVTLLANNAISVTTTTAGIDNLDLSAYQVLVIAIGSAWDTPYTPAEVAAIQSFVGSGKGVLVMADNTDTPNHHINPITQAFGTTCGISYLQPLDLDFSNFIAHPIFAGVASIFYRAAGELDGISPSVEAAFTSGGLPTITVLDPCGLVVTGDSNFCDNDRLGEVSNTQFTLNVFQWLLASCPTPVENSSWGRVKSIYR